ncbi:MAG: class I SAM-dependent methyltransferase [Actinomycetota bacterium]
MTRARGGGEILMTNQSRDNTKRVLNVYERFAPRYDQTVRFWERVLGLDEGRRWVASQARGDVLEMAIGTGRNLAYYPTAVRLTGVDLSPSMLKRARRRVRDLGRDADLRVDDAQALDLPDEAFDTVVITLSLCSIPDERRALAGALRVLRPGGRLFLLEHVRSPARLIRAGQRLLAPLILWLQADHLMRDPLEHLESVGFVVERVERSRWGIVERVAARKPLSGRLPPHS